MIGILPAAGSASRIHGLPKYLLPVGDSYLLKRHVEAMSDLGCRVLIGTNPKSEDLLEQYEGDAGIYVADNYATMTETVLSSRRHFPDSQDVLFGMPDTYFEDAGVYRKLVSGLRFYPHAAVIVALFNARPGQHRKGGMVRVEDIDRVVETVDKPEDTDMRYIWGALAWRPAFWNCMRPEDPHVGYALPRAIADGLEVRAWLMEGDYFDCGTSAEYFECIRAITQQETA